MEFLESTGYKPRIRENFLKHWIDGQIPSGKKDHPVVYVDLDDARAFAEWSGKRLPDRRGVAICSTGSKCYELFTLGK